MVCKQLKCGDELRWLLLNFVEAHHYYQPLISSNSFFAAMNFLLPPSPHPCGGLVYVLIGDNMWQSRIREQPVPNADTCSLLDDASSRTSDST